MYHTRVIFTYYFKKIAYTILQKKKIQITVLPYSVIHPSWTFPHFLALQPETNFICIIYGMVQGGTVV